MSNDWFQFKQFTIYQDKCAMKVCTDSCIFGAYVAFSEKDISNDQINILDVGAGTGLLSLMIAQKVKGNIDAVEIDKKACEQAHENFTKSSWKARLSLSNADITKLEISRKYDVIISNPPFFKNSLKSDNDRKNLAKHTASLSYAELVYTICTNLAEKGRFYVLLPFAEFDGFEKIANENELQLLKRTDIKSNEASKYFRTIGVFSKNQVKKTSVETLIIKDNNNEYTADFTFLMKEYYLYL